MIAKVRNQTLDSFAGLGVVTHDTMAEYEALSQEEKMDGNVHLVLEEEPINANIVEYTDGKTVKDELDDIAEKTGNTDISAIGDGTTTGAIGSLNTHLSATEFEQIYTSVGLKIYKNDTEVLIEFRGQSSAGSALGNIIGDVSQLGGTPHPLIDSFTCVPKNHVVGIASDGKATLYNNALSSYDVDTIYGTVRYKYA